jgi:phage FluMu gp28-like protein
MGSSNPAIPLAAYQRNWVLDKSRFKIGVLTRQGGKSFEAALEAVDDCMEHKTMWVFLSAGERQSKELMAKAAMHARAYSMAIKELEGDFVAENGKDRYKQLEIVFSNDSRIVGLPANPDTARGWSANILLDEFALHRDSREIWKAMFPTVTRGYKIRIISTFRGKSNKFYELFFGGPTLQRYTGAEHEFVGDKGGWSKHFVNIYQAVQMGLDLRDETGKPSEPEDLRLALNDDDAWAEEYECIPSDEVSAFLTHDLISSVEDVRLVVDPPWVSKLIAAAEANFEEYKRTKRPQPLPLEILAGLDLPGDLYVGGDIGRRRDLTVLWLDAMVGTVLKTIAVIELKRTPYMIQEQVLHTICSHPSFRRACLDETGIGSQLAENAELRFGSHRIEKISFTAESKEVLAVGLKENFSDRGSVIPATATIRNSLHSVKKYATTTKHFRFDAERTDATGHADHFWAKALSVLAASAPVGLIEFESTGRKRASMGRSIGNFMGTN